ncbi:MAG: hypothetical protein ISR65_03320 [Bacteriovoracaceae bacterium]|nr:hypothetical protein [Bacteriovoracaceae bacterium]
MSYEWDNSWNIFSEQLNTIHQSLLHSLCKIDDAIKTPISKIRLIALLDDFAMEVETHFEFEEELVRKCACPDFDKFIDNKNKFMSNVFEFINQCKQDLCQLSTSGIEWWKLRVIEHIEVKLLNCCFCNSTCVGGMI